MTMHSVFGDGEMSVRELSKTLEDLLDKAGDQDFWFLVQGKAEPTATDRAMMKWFGDRAVYFEVVTADKKGMDAIYKTAAETYEVKNLAPKVVSLMQERPAEGEEAALYALYVNNNEDVAEDEWLGAVGTAVAEAGYTVYAMNDGLAELGFDEQEEEEEQQEEEEEAPSNVLPMKKAAAKKAAPAKAPAADEEEEPEEAEAGDEIPAVLTREYLESLNLDQLKEIAAARGISLQPRTRSVTYINTLLGEGEEEAPAAEVEEVAVLAAATNGAGPAMLIVVVNGTVISRAISTETALELVSTAGE